MNMPKKPLVCFDRSFNEDCERPFFMAKHFLALFQMQK